MISLKRYLDGELPPLDDSSAEETGGILPVTLAAYASAMVAMGNCSLDACPGIGDGLKQKLSALSAGLTPKMTQQAVESTDHAVQQQLQEWGRQTACHYRQCATEVKELLLVMTRSVEAVGARDQRSAGQMSDVTARLKKIATLDDLSQIRASIVQSAADLKTSIDRMTAEGKAAVEELRREVKTYQAKLEEAEELASRDALTGVRNRMCVEAMMDARVKAGKAFSLAMLDIDGFKKVNDMHGHLAGDELLKQFAAELRSACRSGDVIGRWGGDEFVLLLECGVVEGADRIDRLRRWICGDYTVHGKSGEIKLRVDASIGLAEHRPQEPLKSLIARADAAMYEEKAGARGRSAAT